MRKKIFLSSLAFVFLTLVAVVIFEFQTNYFQSIFFTKQSSKLTISLEESKASSSWFPQHGPTNIRLGYTKIQEWIESLKGFDVVRQASLSKEHLEHINQGNNPIYSLDTNKGLVLLDKDQQIFYDKRQQNQFKTFEEIPPILIEILLFVENKSVLDEAPYHNPAVEYLRFIKAGATYLWNKIFLNSERTAGGSTLATQMEKYNFSEDGKTANGSDKLKQIYSASLRTYLGGRETMEARKKIVLDYFNSIPLGAARNYGELHGFNEGLKVFYGVHLEEELNNLRLIDSTKISSKEQLDSLNRALQIILSVRNPSLLNNSQLEKLKTLKAHYIEIMIEEKIIPYSSLLLIDKIQPKQQYLPPKKSFNQSKSQDLIRRSLSKMLKTTNHDLDKVDLTANTTIDFDLQKTIEGFFEQLKDPLFLEQHGLLVPKLLDQTDPNKVIYSLSLYQLENGEAKLRAIYDSQDQPFSFSDAGKVELGSSAKLRVLTSYLNVVEKAFYEKSNNTLQATDPISSFVRASQKETLEEVLEESLDRLYSANPNETFFTGGGLHRFGNYNDEDNSKTPSIRESFKKSINLPFVRCLRDVVSFYKARSVNRNNLSEEEKDRLLEKFIDKESKVFVERYFKYFKKKQDLDIENYLTFALPKSLIGSAAVMLWINPNLSFEEMFSKLGLENARLTKKAFSQLRELHKNFKLFGINDIGYLAKVHPLMIYVGIKIAQNNQISLQDLFEESKEVRFETYKWLLKTRFEREQLKKIDIILEEESFQKILLEWQSLGYPFKEMIPSLASALGSSGDKPVSLAKLIGIIINQGAIASDRTVEELHFALDTPYEVHLKNNINDPKQVLSFEVAKVLKSILKEVVDDGTAIRLKGSFNNISIGGKTGTGDNRLEVHGSDGSVLDSKALSRTATFVFYLGENWFGNITVYVDEEAAEQSTFTSSLPVTLLKLLSERIGGFIN